MDFEKEFYITSLDGLKNGMAFLDKYGRWVTYHDLNIAVLNPKLLWNNLKLIAFWDNDLTLNDREKDLYQNAMLMSKEYLTKMIKLIERDGSLSEQS